MGIKIIEFVSRICEHSFDILIKIRKLVQLNDGKHQSVQSQVLQYFQCIFVLHKIWISV